MREDAGYTPTDANFSLLTESVPLFPVRRSHSVAER
jgi:hypothetical protein